MWGTGSMGVMARTSRELPVAHRLQNLAQRLLGNRDAVILGQDLSQIDQPPAYHPMRCRYRPLLDESTQHLALLGVQARVRTRGLAADQSVRAVRVEGEHPVPHCLQSDPAQRRSFRINVLEGGAGNDVLSGRAGADTFMFRSGFGSDQITDFTADARLNDVIEWHGQFTSFAGVQATASDFSGNRARRSV